MNSRPLTSGSDEGPSLFAARWRGRLNRASFTASILLILAGLLLISSVRPNRGVVAWVIGLYLLSATSSLWGLLVLETRYEVPFRLFLAWLALYLGWQTYLDFLA